MPENSCAAQPGLLNGSGAGLIPTPLWRTLKLSLARLWLSSQKTTILFAAFFYIKSGKKKSRLLVDLTGVQPKNGLFQALSQWLNYKLLKKNNPFFNVIFCKMQDEVTLSGGAWFRVSSGICSINDIIKCLLSFQIFSVL